MARSRTIIVAQSIGGRRQLAMEGKLLAVLPTAAASAGGELPTARLETSGLPQLQDNRPANAVDLSVEVAFDAFAAQKVSRRSASACKGMD